MPFWARKTGGGLPYTPPLDIYHNSIAAFSVRKLRSAYNGFCMRIENSSGSTLDVGFDSNGYIDTAAILAFSTGRLAVKIWYDQSGNGNNVQNNTYQTGPTIRAGGIIPTTNGKAGTEYFISGQGNGTTVTLTFSTKIQVETLISVARMDTIGIVNYVGYSGADGDGFFLGGTDGAVTGFGALKGGAVAVQNTLETTNQALYTFYGGSTDRLYTNGTNEAIRGAAFGGVFIKELGRTVANGGGVNLSNTGGIQEWIAFSSDKFSDKTSLESNVNGYFSIY